MTAFPAACAGNGIARAIVVLCLSHFSILKRHIVRKREGQRSAARPRHICQTATGLAAALPFVNRGGMKAGAVCARQQAKSGRPPSRPVRGGGLRAYRPRFLFCAAFRHRRSQNHTFCKQPATMATGDRAGSTAYTRNVRNPCTASRRKTG